MQKKTQRKRFIAGARCPKCQTEDKVYLIGEGLDALRCCTQCDFEEKLGDAVEGDSAVATDNPQAVKVFEPVQADDLQPIKLIE